MTDAEIFEFIRNNPDLGYRRIWLLLLVWGHTVHERRLRRLKRKYLLATKYGSFRIHWIDSAGIHHSQGEDLCWNESEATRAAALAESTGANPWIEFRMGVTDPWKRW